jgi:SPP1 family predicted phage head-tail adaptor
MQAGRLNSRVTIQAPSTDVDEIGQPVLWVDFAEVWADIKLKSGMETIKAESVTSTVKASMRIRYRTDINASMRVLHNGGIYSILAVMPDVAGHDFLDLAVQVVA